MSQSSPPAHMPSGVVAWLLAMRKEILMKKLAFLLLQCAPFLVVDIEASRDVGQAISLTTIVLMAYGSSMVSPSK